MNKADMMHVVPQVKFTINYFEARGTLIHYFSGFSILASVVINIHIYAQRPHVNYGKPRVDIISCLSITSLLSWQVILNECRD